MRYLLLFVLALFVGCTENVTGPGGPEAPEYVYREVDLALRNLEGIFVPPGSVGAIWRVPEIAGFQRYELYFSQYPIVLGTATPRIVFYELEQDRDIFQAVPPGYYYTTLVVYSDTGHAYYDTAEYQKD